MSFGSSGFAGDGAAASGGQKPPERCMPASEQNGKSLIFNHFNRGNLLALHPYAEEERNED